jgi:3-isopropylmalate/(R)-2-methylmalate dehydratase small subunit
MDPLKIVRGVIAPLDRANVDTDQIIPKQFLKSISRTGFGENLFFDWRYNADGSPDPDFPLNDKAFENAAVLVTRYNFGCGSSREHAVWAIAQYGFRVVIAPRREEGGNQIPGFADIFRNNCAKNGVLTVELAEPQVDGIFALVQRHPGMEATVDLAARKITLHAENNPVLDFDIDPAVRERLLMGLDDITLTLTHEKQIEAFERTHDIQMPV